MFGNLIFKLKMKRRIKKEYPDGVIVRSSEMDFARRGLSAEDTAIIAIRHMGNIIRLLYGEKRMTFTTPWFDSRDTLPTLEETPDFVNELEKELKRGYNEEDSG